jgi:hypothetical protein
MFVRFAVAASAVLLVGCAQADGPFPGRDNADFTVSEDDFSFHPDFSFPSSQGDQDMPGAPPDDGGVVPVGCMQSEHVVINEVKVAGTGGVDDEFIELYNPCVNAVDLSNWRVVYRSAAGATDVGVVTITKSIPGKGYFLVAETACGCVAMADQTYATGRLAGTAGGVGLRNALNAVVDSVGYGATATNAFVETSPAPVPPSASSTARKPNGSDSNKNNVDFMVLAVPTPKAAN